MMKTNKKNKELQECQAYVPANMTVTNLTAQKIICSSGDTSGSIDSFNLRSEDGLNWLD